MIEISTLLQWKTVLNVTINVSVRLDHHHLAFNYSQQVPFLIAEIKLSEKRNGSHCLVLIDLNAKHHTWSPTSRANSDGNSLFKFSQTFGVDILALNDPTYYPNNQNYLPSTIDFGISKGLQNITVTTSAELASDHNPVCFLVGLNNLTPHAHNQILFTNWINFSDNLSQLIWGNPLINNVIELEEAVTNFTFKIQNSINQSSIAKNIDHPHVNISQSTRPKIKEKNRLRKLWQLYRYPPMKTEINRFQKEIKREIFLTKKQAWEHCLETANTEDQSLFQLVKLSNSTHQTLPPFLGPRGLVFDTQAQADLFVNSLEESFTENAGFYDDEFNEHVECAP
ncbi:RNA-directed DNA polymerase from mobile element jockey [Nephila pilipes]|uniref:RNA-directed DNA polymerase from mobile element jockey n=1 Tax=Nephila pilipes TaxID=299642 RepID=A0A8X6NLB3_NEPPI|nr:RNA-directed DNA polymerase from mobile element jockey [Nephila pilipes]